MAHFHFNFNSKINQFYSDEILYFQMTAIALISSSVHCKNVKPCELQTALDFIYLKYTTHPCKYSAIKEMSSGFLGLGIILLCWNAILFLLTMCICWWKFGEKKQIIAVLILYIIVSSFLLDKRQFFCFHLAQIV